MKRRPLRTWEELEALQEGKWVEVKDGIQVTWVDLTRGSRRARITIPLGRHLAKSLAPRKGEILEARVKGDELVLERRVAPRKPARTRSA